MIGSLFAGRAESPGDVVRRRGQLYKVYRGMASLSAAASRFPIEARDDELDQYVPEGEEMEFPLRGPVSEVVTELAGGLRSGMSYVDATSVHEFWERASSCSRPRRASASRGPAREAEVGTLYHGCHVVTMDDDAAEHPDGWLLVEEASRRGRRRWSRRGRPIGSISAAPSSRPASSTRTTTSTRP